MICTHSQNENELGINSFETQIVNMLEALMNDDNEKTHLSINKNNYVLHSNTSNNNSLQSHTINKEDSIPFSLSIWLSNKKKHFNLKSRNNSLCKLSLQNENNLYQFPTFYIQYQFTYNIIKE